MTKSKAKPKNLKELFDYLKDNPTVIADAGKQVELTYKDHENGSINFEDDSGREWKVPIKTEAMSGEETAIEPGFEFKKGHFCNLLAKEINIYKYA